MRRRNVGPSIDRADPASWPELMTTREVADVLRCTPRAVQKWCAAGRLAFIPVGRRRLIRKRSLLRYLERSEIRAVDKS